VDTCPGVLGLHTTLGGGLPIDNLFSNIWCKLVYSKTKWTIRKLSTEELCFVYEFPSHSIPTDLPMNLEAKHLPFIHTAPSKVLYQIAKVWPPLQGNLALQLEPDKPLLP